MALKNALGGGNFLKQEPLGGFFSGVGGIKRILTQGY